MQDPDLSREHEAAGEWVNSFNALVDQVRSGWPEDFAGAEIVHSSPPSGAVLFKGEPPTGAVAVLATSPVPVDVRSDAGFSESEMAAATRAAHFSVASALPVGTPIASAGDLGSATITTTVGAAGPTAGRGQAGQLEALAEQQVKSIAAGLTAGVLFDPALEIRFD